MVWVPCLTRTFDGPQLQTIALGHPVVDDYLEFVGARLRLNSWVAVAYDLKVFFSVINKDPAVVTTESAWVPRRLHALEVRMEHDEETPHPEEVPA